MLLGATIPAKRQTEGRFRFVVPCIALASILAFNVSGAQDIDFDIDAQPTDQALLDIAEASDVQILFAPAMVEGNESPEVRGEQSVESAIEKSLDATGLEHEFKSEDFVVVNLDNASAPRPAAAAGAETQTSAPVLLAQLQVAESQDAGFDEAPAQGAGTEEDEAPLELAPQTTVGSRLSRVSYETPTQILVITVEELRDTGAPTLERALRRLPQNINGTTEFEGATLYGAPPADSARLLGTSNINGASTINLRGLGESATLILIDGKRVGHSGMLGGYTDVSEFPLSMIERVEIQLDGASAIYGSDAIGGVVNIITRKDAPARIGLRHTARTKGGLSENNATAGYSFAWPTGHAQFGLDLYKATDQNDSASDILGLEVGPYGYPGNVRGPSGTSFNPTAEISSELTQAAIDAGITSTGQTVNRVQIPVGQDGTALMIADFVDSANTFRTNDNSVRNISVTPESERYTLRMSGSQAFEWFDVDAGVTYGSRSTQSSSGPGRAFHSFRVPASNPYNPFGEGVIVDLDLASVFPTREGKGERENWTVDFDLSGTLGDAWEWQLDSQWQSRESIAETFNFLDTRLLEDLAKSESTDPSEVLNVFGNSFLTDGNNAAVLAGVEWQVPYKKSTTENELLSTNLVVRGQLFELPAGSVRLAVGGEWREATLAVDYGANSGILTVGSPVGFEIGNEFEQSGTQTISAGFIELFAPAFSKQNALPGLRDLNFTLSARREESEGSGSAGSAGGTFSSDVWGAGMTWRPFESVTLRVNKSTGFRAPDIGHSLLAPVVTPSFILDFRPGKFGFKSYERIDGGNPELEAEESTSLTYGITVKPPFLEGLTISANHYETKFDNRIVRLNILGPFFVTDALVDQFPFQYTFDEDGELLVLDSRASNVYFVDTRGWDYSLDYQFAVGVNFFGVTLSASKVDKHVEDRNPFDMNDPEDLLGTRIPDGRYTGEFFWERGALRLSLTAQTSEGVSYTRNGTLTLEPGAETVTIDVKTKPALVTNLRGSFDFSQSSGSLPGFLDGLRLSFGINNIFKKFDRLELDPEPEWEYGAGVVRNSNDARGQMYYLEMSKEF